MSMNTIKYKNLFTKQGKIFFPRSGSVIPAGTIIQTDKEFKIAKTSYVSVRVTEKGWDSDYHYNALKPLETEE